MEKQTKTNEQILFHTIVEAKTTQSQISLLLENIRPPVSDIVEATLHFDVFVAKISEIMGYVIAEDNTKMS